jgi:small subunit ribosomal protein S17
MAEDQEAVTPDDETAALPEGGAEPDDETTRAVSSSEATAQQAAESVSPKERRQRARAAKAARVPARPARSSEERQAARAEERRRKAERRRKERQRARGKARAGSGESQPTPPRDRLQGTQKSRQGVVVSDKPDKTIAVRIDSARRHRRYQKIVRTSSTVHAHDERNDASVGDTVVVRESRPLSRTKRWRLVEIVEKAR